MSPDAFLLPPEELVVAWAINLRKDVVRPWQPTQHADHLANTIKTYLSKVSGTVNEFAGESVGSPSNCHLIRDKLAHWKEIDGQHQSDSFSDLPTDLQRLYACTFAMVGWSKLERITVWTMFLTQFGIAGRASDADVNMAEAADGEEREDLPQAVNRRMWVAYTEDVWRNKTMKLFIASGHYVPSQGRPRSDSYVPPRGVTNHGIRSSSAQWAARCGASLMQVKAMGRWKSTDVCSHYVAQGNEVSDHATTGVNGTIAENDDPMQRVWWWKPVAIRGEGGRDQL
ncbi:hypothetical protein AB1Y20_020728 [Prymnesium parvum]|uniref:Tyr recombinase domain-containing protein n=1 Tax=Prymnesium parvum TaxID=97485 RepID=A0AB34JVG8_PRYPA